VVDLLPTVGPLWPWLHYRPFSELRHVADDGRCDYELATVSLRYATVRALQVEAGRLRNPTLNLGWVEIGVLAGKITDSTAARIVVCALSVLEHPEEPSGAVPVGLLDRWEVEASDRAGTFMEQRRRIAGSAGGAQVCRELISLRNDPP